MKRLTLSLTALVVFAAGIILASSLASASSSSRNCYTPPTTTGSEPSINGSVSVITGECADLTLQKYVQDPYFPTYWSQNSSPWDALPVNAGTVNYKIEVTNGSSNNLPVTPVVTDTGCDAAPVLDASGDDGDGLLENGEVWDYYCSHVYDPGVDSSIYQNTAHAYATATGPQSQTLIRVPADPNNQNTTLDSSAWISQNTLSLTKTVDQTTADFGATLHYTIVVHNLADYPVLGIVYDDGCVNLTGPPLQVPVAPSIQSPGRPAKGPGNAGLYILNSNGGDGDTTTFTCQHDFSLGDGDSYTNQACSISIGGFNLQDVSAQEGYVYTGYECASATTKLTDPTVAGLFFEDMNANGVRDPGDPAVTGFKAFLDSNVDKLLSEGESSADASPNGTFALGVPLGTFTMRELGPPGWNCSYPSPDCTYSVTRDLLPVSPPVLTKQRVSTKRPLNSKSYDFGNWRPGSVAGTVIDDVNGNGVAESGEGPLSGVTVWADLDTNGSLDAGEPSVKTGTNGTYLIGNLRPGSYMVRQIVPAGKGCTAPAGGCTHSLTLVSGQAAAGRDFLDNSGQAVAGARSIAGTARLDGRTGCVSRSFRARVSGTRIRSVSYFLDGKRLVALRSPNTGKAFTVRINPVTLKVGRHRLLASVTFDAASGTRAKNMRLTFQRCGSQLVAPQFTG